MQPKLLCNSLSRQTVPIQYVIILMVKVRGCHEPYLSSRIRRYNSRKSLIHSKKNVGIHQRQCVTIVAYPGLTSDICKILIFSLFQCKPSIIYSPDFRDLVSFPHKRIIFFFVILEYLN